MAEIGCDHPGQHASASPILRRGQGIPSDRLDEVIQHYRSGHSLMRLATQFECSAETVRQALRGADATLRKLWEAGHFEPT
jgi:DNA-directed RNA polymerase specialized sigma24 family protein